MRTLRLAVSPGQHDAQAAPRKRRLRCGEEGREVKAISLWQPWATALFLRDTKGVRIKPDETRGWPTAYRGRLAIHAAKMETRPGWDFDPDLDRILEELVRRRTADLPRGCLLGYGEIAACAPTARVRPARTPAQTLWGDYNDLGDNGKKRFAWTINNLVELACPVPWRGAQGLFDVPDSIFFNAPTVTAVTGDGPRKENS